jgi:hypothetical protein
VKATSLLLALFVAAMTLAACGDDSGSGPQTTAPSGSSEPASGGARPPAGGRSYVAEANAICRDTVRDARRVGRRFSAAAGANDPDAVKLAAEGLIKPGIPVLEREARRFRELSSETDDPDLGRYVAIFDPIESLAHDLERATTKGDVNTVRRIEKLMVDLGKDQRQIARELGLRACDVDFVNALTAAAFG